MECLPLTYEWILLTFLVPPKISFLVVIHSKQGNGRSQGSHYVLVPCLRGLLVYMGMYRSVLKAIEINKLFRYMAPVVV